MIALVLVAATLAAPAGGELTLAEAVGAAMASSPDVRQADYELRKAGVAAEGARAEQLAYGANVSVGEYNAFVGLFGAQPPQTISTPVGSATALARWPIFTGFRLSSQIAQADAGVTAGRARAEQARQDLVWQVAQAYWQARRAELRAGVQEDAVTKARQARDVVKASKQIGHAHANELDRAEVTLLNEESELLRAADDATRSRDQLAALMRRDLTGVRLLDPPVAGAVAAPRLDEAIAQARANRPDLRLAGAQVVAQEAAVGVARADRWPQLEAITMYQHGNNPFLATSQSRNVLGGLVGTWDARLNVSYNLLDHGVIGRAIDARELEARAAGAGLEAATRQAELEVRQAIARLALAERRVGLGERSVALATKNLKWLEGRFKFGYAVLTELNEARQNLKAAANQRIDALIDQQLALTQLRKATGTLEAPPPAKENVQ